MKNKTTHTDTYLNNHLKSITDSFDFACVQNISPAKNDIALSYIVICKNSQSTIERCLNSIYKNMTARDELIVLDTGSTDRTVQLIEKTVPKVRILVTNWTNDFARARNIALKSASKDWVFFVDSDEWLDSEDGTSLEAIIKKAQTKKLNFVINPTFSDSTGQIYQTVGRIFPTNASFHYYAKIHEEIRKNDKKLGYDVKHFVSADVIIYHDGYNKEVIQEKNKIKRNISLLQEMVHEEPQNARWTYLLARDGFAVFSPAQVEQLIKKTLELVSADNRQKKYSLVAQKLLGRILFKEGKTANALLSFQNVLKMTNGTDSDALYYITVIKINNLLLETNSIEKELLNYLSSHNQTIDVNSDISGNYFHIAQIILECDLISANYEHLLPLISEIPKEFSNNIKNKIKAASKIYSKLQGDSKDANNKTNRSK